MLVIQSGRAKRFRKYSITMGSARLVGRFRLDPDDALVCRGSQEVRPSR